MPLSDSRLHKTMAQHSSHPERGNKQGTSNCGIQPPTTIISITWILARSGQPLAVTLNGTVRGLTYKQEAGGSSPHRPSRPPLQTGHFDPLFRWARLCRIWAGNKQVATQPPLKTPGARGCAHA